MSKINKVTKLVTIPVTICAIVVGLPMLLSGQVSWWTPILFWLVFGMIITGVLSHRYFGHNSFTVPPLARTVFGWMVPMGGFGSPMQWATLHRQHHRYTDIDGDPHTPAHGFWHAFIMWHVIDPHHIKGYVDNSLLRKLVRDRSITVPSKYFYHIFYAGCAVLLCIDYQLFFAGYCMAILLEYIRLGIIDTLCHMPNFPGNYRNYNTKDNSQNNVVLGILTCGFGWHNNHHNRSSQAILTHRWWEIDIEGYLCVLFEKICSIRISKNEKTTNNS